MTRPRSHRGALLWVVLLAGCSFFEARPDPSRFYILTSLDDLSPTGARPGMTLGLGPMNLPDYLQRPDLMRRSSATELQPSPLDRWAGALESNVSRVVAENLARLLGTDRVWSYPSYEITRTNYLVDITFVRFELDTQNTAHLLARWEVRDLPRTRSASRETSSSAAATSPTTAAGVEALSQTLGVLSQEIATAITEIDRPH